MEINEIKKILYKTSPKAELQFIRKGKVYYKSELENLSVNFEIPVEDMGDADFLPIMEGKLLIRWIIKND